MRLVMFLCVTLIAACAGTPSAPAVSTTPNPVIKASQAAATKNAPVDANGKVNAEALANAKKLGFTPVNQDGQVLYCRSDLKTGSRVERETVCLTLAEIEALRQQTQQQMSDFARRVPPPVTR